MEDVRDRVARLSEAKRALLDRMATADPGHDLEPELYHGTVVPLQPRGTRRPLVLIHATDGSVSYFRYLAACLGPDQPVFALQTPGLNDPREPYGTIRDQAAHYLEEVARVVGSDPPSIAGYCMGGLPAFEMTQQRLRRGEPALPVIHISPIMDRDWDVIEAETDLELRAAHDFIFLADKIMGIQLPVDWDALRAAPDRMSHLIDLAINHRCLPHDVDVSSFARRVEAYRANLNAMRTYRPDDVRACRVRVLVVSRDADRARLEFDSVYTAYLRDVPSDYIEVTPVHADPVGIINGKEPGLGVTARALATLLPAT
jgi:thioesterase domain-containing protein